MLLLLLLSVLLFSPLAMAEVNLLTLISEIPSCTEKCAISELALGGCQLSNLTGCICSNTTLQRRLSTCVLQSCNLTEQIRSSTILQEQVCEGTPQASRGAEIIIITTVLTVITFPVVVLRCASRYLVARKFWWDDWIIIFAAAFLVPLSVFAILYPHYGFGKHIWNVPPLNITLLRKLYYVVQIFYVFVISLARISVLFFYLRVIPGDRFSRMTKICIGWMMCHFFGFLMAVVFQCVPISTSWDNDVKGRCVNPQALGFSGAGAGLFEDLVLIILPVSEFKTLTLNYRKKATLMFMFALGSFTCIASILRLRFMVNYGHGTSPDVTWEQVDVVIWSEIEAYAAVICACLITLRPLLLKYFPELFAVNRAREQRDNSTLPSWRVRRSSKLTANLGYPNNVIQLSSVDNIKLQEKNENEEVKASLGAKESLEIREIIPSGSGGHVMLT
ncbi:hypothetical protein B0J14DRAFT_611015 [Halenospora varia]|nr:hypothetical protein B0J14DRAFT_611015 [Halenospora varia]